MWKEKVKNINNIKLEQHARHSVNTTDSKQTAHKAGYVSGFLVNTYPNLIC